MCLKTNALILDLLYLLMYAVADQSTNNSALIDAFWGTGPYSSWMLN